LIRQDGWVPGQSLFPIEKACEKGTTIMNLLADAAQKETWSSIKKYIKKGKTLYFSHGFAVVYHKDTTVVPPKVGIVVETLHAFFGFC
jgi:ketol-acid reductoisomerase